MDVIECKNCGEKFYKQKVVCPFCSTVNTSSSGPPKSISEESISVKSIIAVLIFIVALVRLVMLFF
ncbi:hypothetical protein [Winogradskyella sp.]|jgi:uncharacterized membrane protein YvbJ|uniref:hypothetical protein n=1 Tax=Winogradskyella sp. TaxID=1883156 RepID=UPI00260156FF|nr:hypothetical protein [Winogradskyella sp.]